MRGEGFFHGNAAAAVRIFVGSNLRYGVGITTMGHQMKTVAVVVTVDDVVVGNNIMGEGVGAANAVAVYFFVGRCHRDSGGGGRRNRCGWRRGGGGVDRSMGLRVDSAAVEFALDVSVPIVFDFVIGSSR